MEEPLGKSKAPGGTGQSKQTESRVDTLPDGLAVQIRQKGPRIGDVVGDRYQLVSLVGDGAMGQVFVAENTTTQVHVAVKVLRPDLAANPELRRRFQVEAQAMAAVDHPNVARFVDVVLGDPTVLVMEYVQGESLAAVIRRERRLDPCRAVRLAARLCWGLDAAHAAGIIHRDLKPGNIMLAPCRETGETPKIIDFGLAKLANLAGAPLTRSGQIVGTPEYMAPEQISGKEVDARADVYGLGCVLYTMLVGRSPFGGADGDVQTLYRQMNEPPTPVVTQLAGVPEELDVILARALAKQPSDRYATTQEMARALEAVLADLMRATDPTMRGTLIVPRSAVAALRRRRWSWSLAAVAAVAAVLGVVVGAAINRPGRRAAAPGAAAAAPAGGGLLIVTTTPAGATVEVDGRALPEPTPTAIRDLAAGHHVVKVRRDGHQEVVRELDVGAGERTALQIVLPAGSRSVTVKTVPSGARVFLDDVLVAPTTPATITVHADEFYQLRVERSGFQPITRNLGPEDAEPELSFTMEVDREPYGAIMVESPSKAMVWIDGVATGYVTPTVAIRLPVGEHTVHIRDSSGARSNEHKVKVEVGVTEHVRLNVDRCK